MAEDRNMVFTVPAPVGGLDGKSLLMPFNPQTNIGMLPHRAIIMDNFFPEESGISLRKGYRVHTTGNMGGLEVKTLAEFVSESGVRKFIAASGSSIYDVTSYNTTATSLSAAFTEARWQTCNYKNRLIMVNGVDQPQQVDATPSTANATYTGISDDNKLVNVDVFKDRLYFVEKNTQNIWYGGVGAITGALTSFPVGDYLSLGGYPIFAGAVTQHLGSGLSDLFAIVTSMGEVLLYSGTYPGGTWALSGKFKLPAPIGSYRSVFRVGGELLILTIYGIIPLSKAINEQDYSGDYTKISDLIDPIYQNYAKEYGTNLGWEGVLYNKGRMLIINIPKLVGSSYEQLVMNTRTGSWCKFSGIKSQCWGVFNDNLYFGGTDGKVYQADYGLSDNSAYIDAELKCAFNYCGDPYSIKHFTLARPQMIATSGTSFLFGGDVDFQAQNLTSTISITGSAGTPWGSSWGSSWGGNSEEYINDYQSLAVVPGRSIAIRIKGSFKNVALNLPVIDIQYTVGGTY